MSTADAEARVRSYAAGNSALERSLLDLARADASFDPEAFVRGAKQAYEMIVTAFAEGNLGKVKTFLSRDVYDNFAGALAERQRAGQTAETTVVGIKASDIIEARMDGRTAVITVKFVSEQINVVRDKDGTVVEGDPTLVNDVTDLWTFTRDTRSRDPNWTLVETHSPN